MRKLFGGLAAFVVASSAWAGVAGAHLGSVNTPSGQSNCQFLGGPGNPGHEGHSHGHLDAQSSEQSDTFDVTHSC